MTLFKNSTHQEIWRQRWCETCFQPQEAQRRIQGKDTVCPFWAQALRTGRTPVVWDRMPRADEMERSIRCNEYAPKPPRIVGSSSFGVVMDAEPLFAVDDLHHHGDAHFIPVEGWPDRRTSGEVDHA
jgi:hypothetical protein